MTQNRERANQQTGFTLLEAMIAIVLHRRKEGGRSGRDNFRRARLQVAGLDEHSERYRSWHSQ